VRAQRPSSRRLPGLDIRRRAQPLHGSRIDRRDAPRPGGGAGVRRGGKIKATIETQPLEAINAVFARLKSGNVNGRIVLGIAARTS
jgi:hypothetical protein